MKCAVCEKESNNKRVCPYCFTPYPREEGQGTGRASGATPRQSVSLRQSQQSPKVAEPASLTASATKAYEGARALVMRQSATVRWAGAGILFVILLWRVTQSPDEASFATGSVPSNIIATPMQREEALALINRTRSTALVEVQGNDEVFVSYPAATFPLHEDGQIALAQQFARADEIVEGRKRRIFFYNPSGRVFAQSDGITGVTVVR